MIRSAHCAEIPILQPEVAYEWTYGAVYSPKWIKGLTLSADLWHIDLRQFRQPSAHNSLSILRTSFPGLSIRDPVTGAIKQVFDPGR